MYYIFSPLSRRLSWGCVQATNDTEHQLSYFLANESDNERARNNGYDQLPFR